MSRLAARLRASSRISLPLACILVAATVTSSLAGWYYRYGATLDPGRWTSTGGVSPIVYNEAKATNARVCQAINQVYYGWASYTCGWNYTAGSIPYRNAASEGFAQNAHTARRWVQGAVFFP